MKKWVSTVMLLSLFGSFVSPLLATAVDTTESSSNNSISKTSPLNSLSNDPQTTVSTESAPIPEKTENKEDSTQITNNLQLETASEFIINAQDNEQFELDLVGKITSSVENNQPISFEMTKPFTLEKSKDEEKIILNEAKETIGTYTIDTTGVRAKYTLNFNKLVKGENRFRLALLGTITRGPDKTLDFYQEDQKIFQLALPAIKESSESSSAVESEASTSTEASKESSTEPKGTSTSQSKTATKDSSKESTENTKTKESKQKKECHQSTSR